MRVLLAHNNFVVTGGDAVFYHEVGRVLRQYGHDVAYFSSASVQDPSSEWKQYFPQPADYERGSLLKRVASFPDMVYNRDAKKAFSQLIRTWNPDIIHAFSVYVKLTPSILDAAREAAVPIVISCNDYKLICPNYSFYHHGHICEKCKGARYFQAALNRCSKDSLVNSVAIGLEAYFHEFAGTYSRNVHTYLFASQFMASKFQEFWAPKPLRYKILRNPVNSPGIEASSHYDDYCLYLGRLHDSKGVDVLIRAMTKCPKAHLKIVGGGPEEGNLRVLADQLKTSNVEFLGSKWGAELTPLLRNCRFVVVPSVWYENFPFVINESFATGKAVIGSDIGGIPELVQHGRFGLLCQPGDSDSFASAIEYLWENPQLAVQMGTKAKVWADREFNDEKFYRALSDIYSEVISDYRKSKPNRDLSYDLQVR
jgi:glycosyltransferase involved in cell wall biosynthesis